jgi:hypothetical protein
MLLRSTSRIYLFAVLFIAAPAAHAGEQVIARWPWPGIAASDCVFLADEGADKTVILLRCKHRIDVAIAAVRR